MAVGHPGREIMCTTLRWRLDLIREKNDDNNNDTKKEKEINNNTDQLKSGQLLFVARLCSQSVGYVGD